ncbi:MAG: c-type cytochrome [Flavobacteriales bacterium]|jgi:cytochrome c|nr:c-type cytochrome [Flavobacteriales bacterium]
MKKLIYFASVLFLISCGSEPKNNDHEQHEVKKEVEVKEEQQEVAEKVEEVAEEAENTFSGDATLGETLFTDKGCVACHQAEEKVVGPSLKEISAGYAENGEAIVLFLKEEGEPIIDPDQYEVMKANFGVTKEMSEDELKALAAYILKH